jgi:hypothetical protein
MAAIQNSCDRVLYLDQGRVAALGEPLEVIAAYRHALRGQSSANAPVPYFGSDDLQKPTAGVAILGLEMFDSNGVATRDIGFGEPVRIRIDLFAKQRVDAPFVNFGIKRGDGVIICNFGNWYDDFEIDYIEGHCSLEGWLPPLRLVPDHYEAHVLVWPWGGGHAEGDMTRSVPYAAAICGDFRVHGPALNAHDGVFQLPSRKWRFTRGDFAVDDSGYPMTAGGVSSTGSAGGTAISAQYDRALENG